jgi:hypothetical protein
MVSAFRYFHRQVSVSPKRPSRRVSKISRLQTIRLKLALPTRHDMVEASEMKHTSGRNSVIACILCTNRVLQIKPAVICILVLGSQISVLDKS